MSETDAAAAGLADAAAMWKVLHDLFRLPGEAQWRWLAEERTRRAVALLAAAAGLGAEELPLPGLTFDDYEQQYLAAFEVGLPHPPAPLIESHWRDEPAPRVLHENILFYRRFGLELRRPSAEHADHLRHQLELMCHLCRLELRARSARKMDEAGQLALARSDFAARRLADWVPHAAAAMERAAPGSWPSRWLTLLDRCCEAAA
jgi:DMSO reductase family type II enzyme chaperone